MEFYKIHPEVPGGLGPNTVYDKTIIPWKLIYLHAIFDGWLGGDLLKISSCYLLTNKLKNRIEKEGLTGILGFFEFEIELSNTFKNIYPGKSLPQLFWMQLIGHIGNDDFAIDAKNKLIVSKRTLDILKEYNLSDCEIGIIK